MGYLQASDLGGMLGSLGYESKSGLTQAQMIAQNNARQAALVAARKAAAEKAKARADESAIKFAAMRKASQDKRTSNRGDKAAPMKLSPPNSGTISIPGSKVPKAPVSSSFMDFSALDAIIKQNQTLIDTSSRNDDDWNFWIDSQNANAVQKRQSVPYPLHQQQILDQNQRDQAARDKAALVNAQLAQNRIVEAADNVVAGAQQIWQNATKVTRGLTTGAPGVLRTGASGPGNSVRVGR